MTWQILPGGFLQQDSLPCKWSREWRTFACISLWCSTRKCTYKQGLPAHLAMASLIAALNFLAWPILFLAHPAPCMRMSNTAFCNIITMTWCPQRQKQGKMFSIRPAEPAEWVWVACICSTHGNSTLPCFFYLPLGAGGLPVKMGWCMYLVYAASFLCST